MAQTVKQIIFYLLIFLLFFISSETCPDGLGYPQTKGDYREGLWKGQYCQVVKNYDNILGFNADGSYVGEKFKITGEEKKVLSIMIMENKKLRNGQILHYENFLLI